MSVRVGFPFANPRSVSTYFPGGGLGLGLGLLGFGSSFGIKVPPFLL